MKFGTWRKTTFDGTGVGRASSGREPSLDDVLIVNTASSGQQPGDIRKPFWVDTKCAATDCRKLDLAWIRNGYESPYSKARTQASARLAYTN